MYVFTGNTVSFIQSHVRELCVPLPSLSGCRLLCSAMQGNPVVPQCDMEALQWLAPHFGTVSRERSSSCMGNVGQWTNH